MSQLNSIKKLIGGFIRYQKNLNILTKNFELPYFELFNFRTKNLKTKEAL